MQLVQKVEFTQGQHMAIYRCQTASQVSLFVGFLILWISLSTNTTKIGTPRIKVISQYSKYLSSKWNLAAQIEPVQDYRKYDIIRILLQHSSLSIKYLIFLFQVSQAWLWHQFTGQQCTTNFHSATDWPSETSWWNSWTHCDRYVMF